MFESSEYSRLSLLQIMMMVLLFEVYAQYAGIFYCNQFVLYAVGLLFSYVHTRGHPKHRSRVLDCWSTGRAISPAPGA